MIGKSQWRNRSKTKASTQNIADVAVTDVTDVVAQDMNFSYRAPGAVPFRDPSFPWREIIRAEVLQILWTCITYCMYTLSLSLSLSLYIYVYIIYLASQNWMENHLLNDGKGPNFGTQADQCSRALRQTIQWFEASPRFHCQKLGIADQNEVI